MDPGGYSNDDPPDDGAPWRGGRPIGERVSAIESEIRHLANGIKQLSESLRYLGDERRAVGDGLRSDINSLGEKMTSKIDGVCDRLETLEIERDEIKRMKRRLLSYAAWLSGIVAATWQVGQVIGPWLRSILLGTPKP